MLYGTILLILYNALCYTGYNTEPVPNRPSACPGQLLACSYPVSIHRFLIIGLFTFREGAGRRGAACAFRARRGAAGASPGAAGARSCGIRWLLVVSQGASSMSSSFARGRVLLRLLDGWNSLEVLLPSFNLEVEQAPPLLVPVEHLELHCWFPWNISSSIAGSRGTSRASVCRTPHVVDELVDAPDS